MTVTVVAQHHCADFDAWRAVFDKGIGLRQENGCLSERVYRAADDPGSVAVIMEYTSREAAAAFMANPKLAEDMRRAGVSGPPTVTFGERVSAPGV